MDNPLIAAIPVDFILFGVVLIGVALFHRFALLIASSGLITLLTYNFLVTGFKHGPGMAGLLAHAAHEWVILTNLFCLLVGFALLADHFEHSHVPECIPGLLPRGWQGAFLLLILVFVLSGFLDNIAGAIIGGTLALSIYERRVHIGYVAAIVAASNAGGAGSVIGDTTTTMMWIAGISPMVVLPAYIAATVALLVFGIPAAMQQHRFSDMKAITGGYCGVDGVRLFIVLFVLIAAIITNVTVNLFYPTWADHFPFLGASVIIALMLTTPLRQPNWSIIPVTTKGSLFLLALVSCASLMPVDQLPAPSWISTFALGFASAIFDNIPLTALAIKQGGYDWALLAYAVGFGGSMIWFGSSSGVAMTNIIPEARSTGAWMKHGWHIPIGYVTGYLIMLLLMGWHPLPIPGNGAVP
ncbi:MAG: citrate transporter [Magnetococcales bacterium]|nr:citrate transporter [Magnetococcales bacterium]